MEPESSAPSWNDLESAFAGALGLSEAEREAFLDGACAGRDGLRAEVQAMLASAGDERGLDIEARLLNGLEGAPTEEGRLVGSYRLLSLLGRGGMGEVYLAEREGGEFEQRAAVKLLRSGLFAPDLAARFRAERQILARLVHPLIVPLLDGGVTGDGRPYLVMQYVPGLPITEHCAGRDLAARERLHLLAGVCRAVQHAHANLVVHRDIKPSNILVTADGEPRLLDFGIAKLLAADGERPVDATQAQVVWVTPERAAPEQLRGEPVSTATDVYALGALLVELLTGHLPRPAAVAEEPEGAGRRRSSETTLRGDLERIAAKALDPDPGRRYASAGQLGEDLERFLTGRPVLAQPDRWAYRARKFVRRHLAATLAAALAAGALTAFAVTSSLQARRIAAERDHAAAEEAKARQVVELLVSFFEETNPDLGPGGDTVRVSDFLLRARDRVGRLVGQPEIQARLEQVLGEIYATRNQFDEARELFARAHDLQVAAAGEDAPLTLDLATSLAGAMMYSGQRQAAEELMRDLLVRKRRVLGPDHRQVSEALQGLGFAVRGEEGTRFAHEALELERRRQPQDPILLANALSVVGVTRMRASDLPGAAALHRESADIYRRLYGDDHPATLNSLSNLAASLTDLSEQEALYRRVLDASRRAFGPESAPVGNRLRELGLTLSKKGAFVAAESVLRESVAVWRQVGGPDHRNAAAAEIYLAAVLDLEGRWDEAQAATTHAIEVFGGPPARDPLLLSSACSVRARALLHGGRRAEALAVAQEAVATLAAEPGRPSYHADAQLALGLALLDSGSAAKALAALDDALALRLRYLAPDDPRAGELRCAQGRALAALGRRAEAEVALRDGLKSFAGWPLGHPKEVAACRETLAGIEAKSWVGR